LPRRGVAPCGALVFERDDGCGDGEGQHQQAEDECQLQDNPPRDDIVREITQRT
jgi:hypothetical protein